MLASITWHCSISVTTIFADAPVMSVIIVALILCQTITLMTVSGIIVVSLADALLVWTAV